MSDLIIDGISLVKTCGCCPEQYEAFVNDRQVGYLRLRHGSFTVEYPDCGGEIIYCAEPNGDGMFQDAERDKYLAEAVAAIKRKIEARP